MIITRIRIHEHHPMTADGKIYSLAPCDLHLNSHAGENGYLIKSSTGLGPPDFISVVEGFDDDGIPIYGSLASKRQVALRIELKPGLGQSYSSLREDLYHYMNRSLKVSLMNESLMIACATGYIRQFETVHFSNKPEVELVIECINGEFSSPRTVDIPLTVLNTLTPVVTYDDGSAPTGFNLEFTVTANHSNFEISDHAKLWYEGSVAPSNRFLITYPFLIGDVVTISTHLGERRINLLRSAVNYDLAGYLNAGAVWPRLFPGVNPFTWTLASSWADLDSATYVPRFWGV